MCEHTCQWKQSSENNGAQKKGIPRKAKSTKETSVWSWMGHIVVMAVAETQSQGRPWRRMKTQLTN